ncbi:hypothetical protein F8E02_05415 [Methanoculleus sp. Wushi-C6]|uniref:Peptidase C39 domain-containing protein n=1 Tax=Methanoculleus caldifontis TaxID=2651577 RepID=A0ABU3X075_9EURY|nr:C39 family peptidase [Methanoculleus sp. Wushi-C6]MDV2481450.1 hypothetical protein [Methanoculleus sp. Wushi-C6]
MHRGLSLYIATCILLFGISVSAGCLQGSNQEAASNIAGPESGNLSNLLTGVPDVRQSQPYSCGAASLQAVLNYQGIDVREGVLMQKLGTTPETGTPPDAIVRVAREYGLSAELRLNLTLADLERSVAEKNPVIIACQAWADTDPEEFSWDTDWEDGHYMVVIGFDSENVYFEDPAMLGTRGKIPRQEFLSRWHDYLGTPPFGVNSTALYQAGIFIRGNESAGYPAFTHVD